MPFYGVRKPQRVKIMREAIKHFPPEDTIQWEQQVLSLWVLPHREEKYCALDWLLAQRQRLEPHHVPLLERLIHEGAWWDLVDPVAAAGLGGLVQRERWVLRPTLRRWIVSPDLWLRRSAILCQLKHGANTDADLLFDFCQQQASDPTIWIRKAIGWALREYSKTDPEAVATFLDDHQDELSPLSLRDAARLMR